MNTRSIVFTLLLALLASGCGRPKQPSASEAPAEIHKIAVRAQPAAVREFERRLTVQGTLEAKNFAHVAARVEGNLDAVWVDEGDAVIAGETPLFLIDPVGRQNALTIAEQHLEVAKASLDVAKASAKKVEAEARKAALDFARYERLYNQKKVTDHEYETRAVGHEQAQAGVAVAKAQVALAKRQVKQAEASLTIARKNLSDTKIIAPISGIISERKAEPGEQMSVGKVALRIDDPSSVEAAAFLPGQYYAEVIPGQTKFRLVVNGKEAGVHTVAYRSPTINPSLRTFEIKGLIGGSESAVVPGNMADLTIVFETRSAIGIPSAAVLVRGGKSVVFLVRDGMAEQRDVQTGLQNDAWTEILSGLEAGDIVVIEGQTQLRDGQAIEAL